MTGGRAVSSRQAGDARRDVTLQFIRPASARRRWRRWQRPRWCSENLIEFQLIYARPARARVLNNIEYINIDAGVRARGSPKDWLLFVRALCVNSPPTYARLERNISLMFAGPRQPRDCICVLAVLGGVFAVLATRAPENILQHRSGKSARARWQRRRVIKANQFDYIARRLRRRCCCPAAAQRSAMRLQLNQLLQTHNTGARFILLRLVRQELRGGASTTQLRHTCQTERSTLATTRTTPLLLHLVD